MHYQNLHLLAALHEHTCKVHLLAFILGTHTLAGVDFSGDNITSTISPGDSRFVVQFQVFDDQIQENSENFIGLLHFSGDSTGAVIGRNAIRLIIEDNGCKLVKPQKPTIILPIAITLIVLITGLGIAAFIVFWKRKRLGMNSSKNL